MVQRLSADVSFLRRVTCSSCLRTCPHTLQAVHTRVLQEETCSYCRSDVLPAQARRAIAQGHPTAAKWPEFVHLPTGDALWMHAAEMSPEVHAALTTWDLGAAARLKRSQQVRAGPAGLYPIPCPILYFC